jgi:hypothetical protein
LFDGFPNTYYGFQCFSTECLQIRSNLTADQKKTKYCTHLQNAYKAAKAKEYADKKDVQIKDLKKILTNHDDLKVFKDASHVLVYVLPGNNLVVPTFSPPTHESPLGLIHIKDENCPLSTCKEKKSKLHTLTSKSRPLCLHTLLAYAVKKPGPGTENTQIDERGEPKTTVPKINRELSINEVVSQIQENFPCMTSIESDFLAKSRKFTEKLLRNSNKNQVLKDHTAKKCKFCSETVLMDWPFRAKKAFLLSMGHLAKIEVTLKVCPKCRRAFYPGNVFY